MLIIDSVLKEDFSLRHLPDVKELKPQDAEK
jgi:hypothetical protein